MIVDDVLAEAIKLAPARGSFAEFGVATGTTLKVLAANRFTLGFDSFQGLPEAWNRLPKGEFAQKDPPLVANSRLVIGLYGPDTLKVKEPCALLHVDCDLYQSAKIALEWFKQNRAPNAVVVFDEFFGYESCEQHEQRAWAESGIVGHELFRSSPEKQKVAFWVP